MFKRHKILSMLAVRGTESLISLAMGFAVIDTPHLQEFFQSTSLGSILGGYTKPATAATTGALTRLGLDLFGGALLYRVNKDIYPDGHVMRKFSADFLRFSLLTRGLEAAASVITMHYIMYHTNASDNVAILTNGKVFMPLFLIGEPMIYSRMVLHENPLPKAAKVIKDTAASVYHAGSNLVTGSYAKARQVAATLIMITPP